MSRKHYVAAAQILARHTARVPWVSDDQRSTAQAIAADLADMFAADNPRFDRARFFTAAGVVS